MDIPFSSRHLLECFELGAEKFGWSKRTPDVGSMKRDGLTLGWGMAGCSWIAARFPAEASVRAPRRRHGPRRVRARRISAPARTRSSRSSPSQKTGVPLDKVEVALGDTSLPEGPALGRFDGDRIGGPGRLCGGRQCDRVAADHRDDNAGIAVREAQARRSGLRGRPGLCEGRRSRRRRAVRRRAPPRQPSAGHGQRQVRGDIRQSQSRSSRRTHSAVTSSRSRGSRRSLGCASAAS